MFSTLAIILYSLFAYHPVHLSVTNIEYNEQQKKFEVSIRVFIDDFEKIINYQNNINLKLEKEDELSNANYYINKYITDHLKLKINGSFVPESKYKLKKREKKDITLWLYYEIKYNKKIEEIDITNQLMTDLYKDQKNMLILTIHKKQYAMEYSLRKITNKISLK